MQQTDISAWPYQQQTKEVDLSHNQNLSQKH